jgi:Protein of unknown function (DUF3995)
MRHRTAAYLAAAWAIAFAAPHLYWATGRTEGLGTSLRDDVVRKAGLAMALSCAAIAIFCLCGSAAALATIRPWPRLQRPVRRVLLGLVWFGAVLLILRSLDIYVEFGLVLTGLSHVPADHHDNFLHLARWFMFFWLPWFVLGAISWTRLAWKYTTSGKTRLSPSDETSKWVSLSSQ